MAGRATLEILPALAGDLYSNALGLNDRGQAGGNSWDAGLDRETAIIWQAGSGVQAISGSTALGNARAIGINNARLVVGSSASGALSWQAGVGLQVFDGSSSAYAINGNGQIAGSVNASPARWQGAAVPEQLSSQVGDALGINAAGDAVGTTYAKSGQAAMLWTAGESFELFGWTGGERGKFGSLLLPIPDSGLVWDTALLYACGALRISAVPEPAQACQLLAGPLVSG